MDDHRIMLCDPPLLLTVDAFRIDSLGRGRVDSDWSTATSYRNLSHTLMLVEEGDCTITVDGTAFRLRPGALHAIPGHRLIGRRTGGMDHRHVNYRLAQAAGDLRLSAAGRVLSFPLASHAPWRDALVEATDHPARLADDGLRRSALAGLLAQVAAALLQAAGPRTVDLPPAVAAALVWIDAHYHRRPSLAAIARAVGRSPAHLHAVFTAVTSRSPVAYALDLRMAEALRRLSAGEGPIAAVAVRCGYTDPLHFSRVVRRYFGRPPSALRRAGGGLPHDPR